jgi:hypothetical protein
MSLRPNGLTQIPAETSRVARAAFPKGCLAMRARDGLGRLFTDEQFARCLRQGVVQRGHRLGWCWCCRSSRASPIARAADAGRARLGWKYALGLDLRDPGVAASVLTEFARGCSPMARPSIQTRYTTAVAIASHAAWSCRPRDKP